MPLLAVEHSRSLSSVRQRSFKVVGKRGFAKLPKLRRQFGPRRGLYAGTRQSRTRKVCPVGNIQFPAGVFVTNSAHFLHAHLRRRGTIQRHGWIRKRQPASPTTSDVVPDAVLVQQRPTEAHRPNGDILPRTDIRLHAADVRLPNIHLDGGLLPQQLPIAAQDHQIEVVGSDVRSCGRSNDDHREDVGIVLCAFKEGSEPMEGRCRWPPAHRLLEDRLVHRISLFSDPHLRANAMLRLRYRNYHAILREPSAADSACERRTIPVWCEPFCSMRS